MNQILDLPDYEFDDFHARLEGTLRLNIEAKCGLNADIGGVDGLEITYCEIVSFTVEGLTFTRDMLIQLFTLANVQSIELEQAQMALPYLVEEAA